MLLEGKTINAITLPIPENVCIAFMFQVKIVCLSLYLIISKIMIANEGLMLCK